MTLSTDDLIDSLRRMFEWAQGILEGVAGVSDLVEGFALPGLPDIQYEPSLIEAIGWCALFVVVFWGAGTFIRDMLASRDFKRLEQHERRRIAVEALGGGRRR